MDDSQFERMPNPFSPFAQERTHRRRHLLSTAKLLLVTVALFALASAGQAYLHRAKLTGLLADFAHSGKHEKIGQLEQMRASGAVGIPGIVAAVGDRSDDVSIHACEMLCEMGPQWNTLPTDQRVACQKAFADALAELSEKLAASSGSEALEDPRLQRAESLARQAVCQWMPLEGATPNDSSGQSEVAGTLTEIIARFPADPEVTANARDASKSPLPIELTSTDAASWTDWPPTSTAPKLYRRSVATLDVTTEQAPALGQWSSDAVPSVQRAADEDPADRDESAERDDADVQLVKPNYRTAVSLDESPRRVPGGTTVNVQYWVTQLKSPSRHVRLRAVTELGRRQDAEAMSALRDHLPNESDHGVAFRIRQIFED